MDNFETITANLSGKNIETRYVDGQKFWVVPVTIAKHGVMSGSNKAVYYPDEVWSSTFNRWDKQPVIINHVYNEEGNPVSCRTEDSLDEVCVGFVDNTRYEDNKLKTEFWLSEDRLYQVNSTVAELLKARKNLEVSTGLFSKTKPAEDGAIFNGSSYKKVLVDYVADHVAILTDEKGACSVSDGCGTFNSSGDFVDFKDWAKKKLKVTLNELSHQGIRFALEEQLRDRFSQNDGHVFIYDVYSDYIIYSQMGELFRLDYSGTEDNVTLSDQDPVKVQRVITYVTANEESDMPKEDKNTQEKVELDEKKVPLINALVANCQCPFTKDDEAILNGMSEDRLKELDESFKKPITNQEDDDEEEEEDKDKKKKATANKGEEPKSAEDWFNEAPPEVKATFNHAHRLEQEHKRKLVDRILANAEEDKKDDKAVEKLMNRSVEDLEEIVNYLPEPKEEEDQTPNFRTGIFNGAVGGKQTANSKKSSPLRLPTPVFTNNNDSQDN